MCIRVRKVKSRDKVNVRTIPSSNVHAGHRVPHSETLEDWDSMSHPIPTVEHDSRGAPRGISADKWKENDNGTRGEQRGHLRCNEALVHYLVISYRLSTAWIEMKRAGTLNDSKKICPSTKQVARSRRKEEMSVGVRAVQRENGENCFSVCTSAARSRFRLGFNGASVRSTGCSVSSVQGWAKTLSSRSNERTHNTSIWVDITFRVDLKLICVDV